MNERLQTLRAAIQRQRPVFERYRPWLPLGTFVFVLLFGAAWLVIAGPANQERSGTDIFVFVDGAWRVLQGQRPHVDFNTSLGFGIFLVYAAGFKLFGLDIYAIPPTIALVGIIVGTWTWLVARVRIAKGLAALCALVAAYCVYWPAFLDEEQPLSYLGFYNKLGHALLIPVVIDCLAREQRDPEAPKERLHEILLGMSTGLALTVFATTKMTYLMPSLVAIVAGSLLYRRTRGWWLALVGTLAAATLATTIYLRGDLMAPVRDFLFVAAARSSRVGELNDFPLPVQMRDRGLAVGPGKMLEVLRLESEHLAALLVVALASFFGTKLNRRLGLWLVGLAAVVGTALFVAASSYQWAGVPLIVAAAAIIVNRARALPRSTEAIHSYRVAVVIATLLGIQTVGKVSITIAYASAGHEPGGRPAPPVEKLHGDAYEGFYVVTAGFCQPHRYGTRFNEAMQLLQANTGPQDRLLVADFANPFSFALRRPSPRGDAVSWSSRASFSRTTFIPPDVLLHDVDAILVPKCPLEPETTYEMVQVYGQAFDAGYAPAADSEFWQLMKRKRPRAP